jgi:hypothetical protein
MNRDRALKGTGTAGAGIGLLAVALAVGLARQGTSNPAIYASRIQYVVPRKVVQRERCDSCKGGSFSERSFAIHANWLLSAQYWGCGAKRRSFEVSLGSIQPAFQTTVLQARGDSGKFAYRIARGGLYYLIVRAPDKTQACSWRMVVGY